MSEFRIFILHVAVFTFLTNPTYAEGDLPVDIHRSRMEYVADVSPISMQWVLQRKSSDPIEVLVKKLGSKRYDFYRPEIEALVVDQEKFFWELKADRFVAEGGDAGGSVKPHKFSSAFDGDVFYGIEGDDPVAYVVDPKERHLGDSVRVEALMWCGLRIEVGSPLQCDILAHLDSDGELVSVEFQTIGTTDFVVVTIRPEAPRYKFTNKVLMDRRQRYFLDPSKGYAVAQVEWLLPDERLVCRALNTDWIQLSNPALWLPKTTKVQWYTWFYSENDYYPEGLFSETITRTKVTRDLGSRPLFHPDLGAPGIYVSDFRPAAAQRPGAQWNEYRNSWDYTNLPAKVAVGAGNTTFRIALILLNVIVFGSLAWLLWRRGRA